MSPRFVTLLRFYEQSNETRRALGVRHAALRHELRQKFLARETRRQLLWLEVGRNDDERIVMRRSGRRAGARIEAHALRALAAGVLIRFLADLAFREARDV